MAPADYCEAAGLPRGTHWPVVVAAVLDEVSNSQQGMERTRILTCSLPVLSGCW